jgi:hypothetical protein
MTAEQAGKFASMSTCPEAAAPLHLLWRHGLTAELRARACLAVAVLDPLVPMSSEAAVWLANTLYRESARELERQNAA